MGVIAIGIGDWGSSARFVLFAFSLGMLGWVIYAFMQYMQVLARIGRVGHTIETIERAVGEALQNHVRAPLGGGRAVEAPPVGSTAVLAARVGFVQLVDMDELQQAQRALSPAVNDPGTAGAVIARMTRLLVAAYAEEPPTEAPKYTDIFASPCDPGALIRLAYDAVARDGAGRIDVQEQLLGHLAALAACARGPIARRAAEQASRCLERARASEMAHQDLASLERDWRAAFRA